MHSFSHAPTVALALDSDGRSPDYCAKRAEAAGRPGATPPPQDGAVCGIRGTSTELTAGSFPMSGFVRFLWLERQEGSLSTVPV